jgi:two-component system, chemotaxis family, chemotaxis protein CheY
MSTLNDGANGGLRLLIVDDSAMMRRVIARAATLTGVSIERIHEAENGRHALQLLETEPIDVVITDINMPVMNGTELLRAMAARESWNGLLRIVVSTDGSDARREEANELKVRLYLEKPFRPEAIRDVLSEIACIA